MKAPRTQRAFKLRSLQIALPGLAVASLVMSLFMSYPTASLAERLDVTFILPVQLWFDYAVAIPEVLVPAVIGLIVFAVFACKSHSRSLWLSCILLHGLHWLTLVWLAWFTLYSFAT